MSNAITNLEPKLVWENFDKICQIPHPSEHEEAIRAYFIEFGKKHNLETKVDKTGNILISKPATKGMENRQGVVLQGHMDMVPQKNSDKKHDFTTDPITPIVDGDWVKADGTTLGADNGMGVAASLAVLQSTTLEHGPIEVLITSNEETGMDGAFGLESGWLKGDILLNLDSEDEGELYVGCAGGEDATITFQFEKEAVPAGSKALKISLTGLKGGHSGVDIHLQRGNANKLMNRFFNLVACETELRINSIDGGSLRNAIPRESFAVVCVPEAKVGSFKESVINYYGVIAQEFKTVEPEMQMKVEPADMPAFVIDKDTQKRMIAAIYSCPNGVVRMSDDMKGLVETSNNLAMVKFNDNKIEICSLMRSSVDSAKFDLQQMIKSVFKLAGAEVVFEGAYPGWKPNLDSKLLPTMLDLYKKMYNVTPEIRAIHAGLECGLLSGAYPHWDMISFGPTIRFPHSPDEKVNIASVQKFWDYLVETLKIVPTK